MIVWPLLCEQHYGRRLLDHCHLRSLGFSRDQQKNGDTFSHAMSAFDGLSIMSAPAERQHCIGEQHSHATLDHADTLGLAQTFMKNGAGCVIEVLARWRHSLPCAVPSASKIPSRPRPSELGTSHAWAAAASSNSLTSVVITTSSHGLTCQSRTGVKQGCPLSPNLFGFYVDGLHRYCALMALLMYLAFLLAQQFVS